MDDKVEKELMWDRLKYVRLDKPKPAADELRDAWLATARSMGKTGLTTQSLGRALRNVNATTKT